MHTLSILSVCILCSKFMYKYPNRFAVQSYSAVTIYIHTYIHTQVMKPQMHILHTYIWLIIQCYMYVGISRANLRFKSVWLCILLKWKYNIKLLHIYYIIFFHKHISFKYNIISQCWDNKVLHSFWYQLCIDKATVEMLATTDYFKYVVL